AHPFDVTIAGGVATELPEHDPVGEAWVQSPGTQLGLVQGPLRLWIAADDGSASYLRVRFSGPPTVTVSDPEGRGGVVQDRLDSATLEACAKVVATTPTRRVSMVVQPPSGPLGAPLRRFEQSPTPAKMTRVIAVSASAQPCK